MGVAVITVAFTGHRPDKLGGYDAHNPTRGRLAHALTAHLFTLAAEHNGLTCISGMALGFDQLAAGVCVQIGIPFIAAVPFEGQEAIWPASSQASYRELLAKAAKVVVVCRGGYSPHKMQLRNQWMVSNCDLLVAAWDGSPGGTHNCIKYAERVGRRWENLL